MKSETLKCKRVGIQGYVDRGFSHQVLSFELMHVVAASAGCRSS